MQNAETAGPSTSGDGHLMRDAKLLAANYEKCIALRILLQDISATMSMRIQAIESSLGVSEVALEAQDAAVLNMVQAHEQVEEELNAIFAVLQHHRVDPALISGEAKKTLFDFIDADTVMDLQRQAKTHIHRCACSIPIQHLHQPHADWAHGRLVDSRRRNADSVNALRSTVLFYQGLDFNKMVPRSAPEHSVWEALGDVCQSVQEEVYELKLRHTSLQEMCRSNISDAQRNMDESSAMVQSSTAAVHQLTELYDVALMYFVDMEQCDRRVLHTFSTMHDVSQMYDVALVECHALLDELSNLLRFYQRFVGAYVALPLEMQRRREYDATTRRMVAELQERLTALEATERQHRSAFADEHAQFLPASLCPSIKDAPYRPTLVMDPPPSSHECNQG
ncbi:hypothetical protein H310_06824 [Aphanomyces invadans]|uniref:Autophagy protein ATG17-like domain-containing protein n=1 Tax=Aphanomyces invadans TaxID=157072 RepID=A0A024U6J7_9STRA|nr:hypothetical protein H310_06824 [Aphanomyces invadans]ETW01238.1 hypothetical protein H310_06824 [Aphanomyces invadans]|eukprot:XP_008870236.1 hypothetical protein H310_06824 [Aphanomyces invadans]